MVKVEIVSYTRDYKKIGRISMPMLPPSFPFPETIGVCGRSWWPCDLKHELSSLSRTLWLWVRIPLKAWMFGMCICLFCVCVVLCLGKGLATGWSPVQGFLLPVYKIKKLKSGQGPAKGCRAKKNRCMWISGKSFCSKRKNNTTYNFIYIALFWSNYYKCHLHNFYFCPHKYFRMPLSQW
jgi:hypothetical protein